MLTTPLSATLLELAAAGAGPLPMHALVDLDRTDWRSALRDLEGLGASSGRAIALGVGAAAAVLGARHAAAARHFGMTARIARPPPTATSKEPLAMSHPERRPGGGMSRRSREQRAYYLTLATGGLAVAAVVVLVLTIVGITNFGLFLLLAVLAAIAGFLLRRTLNP